MEGTVVSSPPCVRNSYVLKAISYDDSIVALRESSVNANGLGATRILPTQVDSGSSAAENHRLVASHFTFNQVPLRLNLVKRRGTDPTVHIAGFKDVPVCLTSKGAATAKDSASYERVDGTMNCGECASWAKTFENSWIKSGETPRIQKPPD